MGNAALTCVSNGGGRAGAGELRKIRVLLPDGNIALLDKPVEAVNLMLEHLNHMVVHCSTAGSQSMGKRATMSILQPHEKLQPGQAYVVHPIPAQCTKTTRIRPQPLSLPKRNAISKITPVQGDGAETQEQANLRQKSAKRHSLHRFQRVADSASGLNSEADARQTPELDSDARQKPQQHSKDFSKDAGEDDEGDIVLNLNMYMGWRPALESIPESPIAYNDQSDTMKPLPLVCV